MKQLKTQKNSSTSINFDTSEFEPTSESLKIYDELNAISKEIDQCRERNLYDILIA